MYLPNENMKFISNHNKQLKTLFITNKEFQLKQVPDLKLTQNK